MSKFNADQLAELPDEALDERIAAAMDRAETRAQRAAGENRDFTDREAQLQSADRDELVALRAAVEIREQDSHLRSRNNAAVQQAIDAHAARTEHRSAPFQPTLLVSEANLAAHAEALREGRPFGAVENRARVTVAGDLGSAGAWHAGSPNEPRYLVPFAGIPVSELTGRTAQVPQYSAPAATAGVDESTAHNEYDAINPVSLTGLRYGRWTLVSALANVVDDLSGVNQMHGWGIARDLDLLTVTSIQTAAAAPVAFASLERQVRQAILQVSAATYSAEEQLVIIGTPADLALLTDTVPANGSDAGSVVVRYHGAKLYPTLAAAADQVTVFAPSAFRIFQTRLQSATLIDPADGSNKFGSWIHSTGVAQQIAGSAVAVETSA